MKEVKKTEKKNKKNSLFLRFSETQAKESERLKW